MMKQFIVATGLLLIIALGVVVVLPRRDRVASADSSSLHRPINLQFDSETYPNREIPCPAQPDLSEIEGETVVCGILTVPEDYGKPEGNKVELVYAILRSTSLAPAGDPVVYLHGGPGSAEMRQLAQLTERFESLRRTRDVIVFDQRGTGYSNNRLACDVEYATQQDDARGGLDALSNGSEGNNEVAVNMLLYQVCLDRFEAIGTDLTQYNTLNNARDVVTLIEALGYTEFNLYGFSYGTQVALEVMRRYPEQLRSVILDSVAPAHIKLYENLGQPNVEALLSLFYFCEVDPDCQKAYPDLQERFVALLDKLDEQPITTVDGRSISSVEVVAALRQSDIRPGLGGFFPLMIWELERGETTTLDAILNNQLPPTVSADFDPVALRYTDLDLSADAEQFIESALALRRQARELEKTADSFLNRGEAQIVLDEMGTSAASRFDLAFHEAMNAQPFDQRLELNVAYLALPLQEPTVDTVRAFVTDNFQGVYANQLLAIADSMDEEDVVDLTTIIFGKARDYAYLFAVQLALRVYVCQEHVPFNSVDGAFDAFDQLIIPQVGTGKRVTVQNLLLSCALFPTGQEVATFHEPVKSDIPTLVLLGSADTQTAISWGMDSAENLANSQVVLFPETGHGAIRYSQCAKDIGAAFLNNPSQPVNTTCTQALLPVFVLPPE
ncbi:MAG: alpha/beta hydrolase [Anaerolineae bacterium]|nr:alpha/beta hydrolase [Anaerolineae bacterium]